MVLQELPYETDGFDLDTADRNYNRSGATYVAWQWKANGGTNTPTASQQQAWN